MKPVTWIACVFAAITLWCGLCWTSEARAEERHTVKSGDTLGSIAIKYGCRSSIDLKRANNLSTDALKIGQVIKIPNHCAAPSKAPAPSAKTATAGGKAPAPAAKAPASGVKAAAAPPAPQQYKVKGGDTLGAIAAKFGCNSSADLRRTNGLKSDALSIGQTLDVSVCSDLPSGAEAKHTVKAGEVISKIATKYGCSPEEIKRVNRLKDDNLKVGQILKIPTCSPAKASLGVSSSPSVPTVASKAKVDTAVLPALMARHGFKPPPGFKAFIIEINFDKTRTKVTRERYFDYSGTSDDATGWNPASTVKLFAVISAMQRVRELGFSHKAKVTFHTARGDKHFALDELIRMTLVNSNNLTYNRVVQLASHDRLNGKFLVNSNGFRSSAITGAYQVGDWTSQGESKSLKTSPAITLSERSKTHTIGAHTGKITPRCGGSACTTPRDLGEAMRRLMLQEQLPASQTFNLHDEDLKFIRQAMRAERSRGNEVVDKFADVFNNERVLFYSKPGFAGNWFSDNVYIFDPRVNQAWVVVLAGSPGRSALDSAAHVIAKIIANGELRRVK
jgi:LysM repeat protein